VIDTTSGGKGLKYTSDVLLPEEVKGRKFFGFINLENPNSQAQEIGQREFGAMRRAMGIEAEVDDSEQLHFIPYFVKLDWGKPNAKKGYDGNMEVKRYYFPDEGNLPVPALDQVQKPKPLLNPEAKAAGAASRQASRPAATNNNQRPAGNDNKPAQKTAAGGAARPWGKK
jgi:hypothetical protein